jgi:hypothetical protein
MVNWVGLAGLDDEAIVPGTGSQGSRLIVVSVETDQDYHDCGSIRASTTAWR